MWGSMLLIGQKLEEIYWTYMVKQLLLAEEFLQEFKNALRRRPNCHGTKLLRFLEEWKDAKLPLRKLRKMQVGRQYVIHVFTSAVEI